MVRKGGLEPPRYCYRQPLATRDELFDEETRHDRLASAGIVCQQKAEWLARQHRFVDRRNLVRERVHEGRVNGQHGVKEVSEADSLGL
jgi:hypothetical protein